ncbi:urease accessory protein UreD [Pendulispora brunnea]|uniref:Urease accessory protein UreD n=1 Tax=Pendulispora brunnea TaxID=2905690 RepID=A0ABZ2KHL2_9BACT
MDEDRAGRGRVVAAFRGGKNVLERAYAESPLRLLLPKTPYASNAKGPTAAWVCVTSLGGGLVRGDALRLAIDVEEGSTLLLTTQASTKAYRGSTRQVLHARVEGTLVALPDPVACFAGSTYESEVVVTLGAAGTLVLVDAFTSGRAAYGERWAFERLASRIHVDRGEPLLRDATVLDARHGPIAARFGRVDAYATVVAIGARAADVMAAMLAPRERTNVLYAPSKLARGDGVVARVAAERTEDVLREIRVRLGNIAEMCGVDPYASRH